MSAVECLQFFGVVFLALAAYFLIGGKLSKNADEGCKSSNVDKCLDELINSLKITKKLRIGLTFVVVGSSFQVFPFFFSGTAPNISFTYWAVLFGLLLIFVEIMLELYSRHKIDLSVAFVLRATDGCVEWCYSDESSPYTNICDRASCELMPSYCYAYGFSMFTKNKANLLERELRSRYETCCLHENLYSVRSDDWLYYYRDLGGDFDPEECLGTKCKEIYLWKITRYINDFLPHVKKSDELRVFYSSNVKECR